MYIIIRGGPGRYNFHLLPSPETMDPNPRPASLTLSPQSPPLPNPSSSSSSIFRPRRSEDWQNYRETIEQLYRNDQLKLRDVKRIMERDYNFYAS